MPEFKVHVYAIVRVPITVTAETPEAAARAAAEQVDDAAIDRGFDSGEAEYADDNESYLVDCPDGGEVTLGPDFAASQPRTADEFKKRAQSLSEQIRQLVNGTLSHDGDTEETSQRLCVINALNKLDAAVNGVRAFDMSKW